MTADPSEFDLTRLLSVLEPEHCANRVLPDRGQIRGFSAKLLAVLFPPLTLAPDEGGEPCAASRSVKELTVRLQEVLRELPELLQPVSAEPRRIAEAFVAELPILHEWLSEDARAMFEGDPAARSVDEVVMTYPGFLALALYRIGNFFYGRELPVFARVVTEYGHQLTGIDIHPGARIGRRCCIDHGTGIVIGETTVIEDDVKLYQGVTLGALSVSKEFANRKRHPTIERNVVLYANATVLGGDTVVGHDSIIGGSAWVTQSVPPHSTVYHKVEVSVRPGTKSS